MQATLSKAFREIVDAAVQGCAADTEPLRNLRRAVPLIHQHRDRGEGRRQRLDGTSQIQPERKRVRFATRAVENTAGATVISYDSATVNSSPSSPAGEREIDTPLRFAAAVFSRICSLRNLQIAVQ